MTHTKNHPLRGRYIGGTSFYGEGQFTIGKTYEATDLHVYQEVGMSPDALFTDDADIPIYEELCVFDFSQPAMRQIPRV